MLKSRGGAKGVGRLFARDTRGTSAVEFAFVLPVLLLLLAGAVDLSGAVTSGNRGTYIAEALGQIVSQAKSDIGQKDLDTIIRSAALADPDLLNYARQANVSVESAAEVTISSVEFKMKVPGCVQNCQYEAHVVFSSTLTGASRPCGQLSAGSGYSATTLPADVFAIGPLIVVDVKTYYKPLLALFLGEKMEFRRASYFRPRYLSPVKSDKNCREYAASS